MQNIFMDFYKDFYCTGSECVNTCCQGWAVEVEGASRAKYEELYKRIKHEDKPLLVDAKGTKYIRMDDGYCPFLTEDKLCRIYIEAGEAYMCDVCKQYPRSEWVIDKLRGKILAMSCSEVAQKILFHDGIIEFDIEQDWDTIITEAEQANMQCFIDRFSVCIDIMQYREYSMSTRLQLLLLFNNELEQAEEKGEDSSAVIMSFTDEEVIKQIVDSLSAFKGNGVEFEAICLNFSNNIKMFEPITKIARYYNQSIQKMQKSNHKGFASFLDNERMAIIFENYAVYYLLSYYALAYQNKKYLYEITLLVILSALMAALLGGFDDSYANLSESEVVDIVSNFSREFEHERERGAWVKIYNVMEQKGYCDLSYILSLLA